MRHLRRVCTERGEGRAAPGVGRAEPGTHIDGTAASIAEKQRRRGQTARFDLILF